MDISYFLATFMKYDKNPKFSLLILLVKKPYFMPQFRKKNVTSPLNSEKIIFFFFILSYTSR